VTWLEVTLPMVLRVSCYTEVSRVLEIEKQPFFILSILRIKNELYLSISRTLLTDTLCTIGTTRRIPIGLPCLALNSLVMELLNGLTVQARCLNEEKHGVWLTADGFFAMSIPRHCIDRLP